ncbi:hypothetical protein O9992_27660 [Vibrio lentus]|nr:hypothetical protein [Vibrio lentus]
MLSKVVPGIGDGISQLFQNPQVRSTATKQAKKANHFVEQWNELTGEEYRLPTESR